MSNKGSIGGVGCTPQINTDQWSALEKQTKMDPVRGPSCCGGLKKPLGEPTYRKIGRRKILEIHVHDPGTTANATAKLNRIYLCTFNRMAQSCIYFVLFLVILSPNTSCALRSSEGETQNYAGILSNSSRTTTSPSRDDDDSHGYSNSNSNSFIYKVDSGPGGDRAGQAQTISGGKYDNNNYENTHTNASAKDEEVEHQMANSLDFDGVDMFGAFSIPEEAIYTNEFAVNIPAGQQVADVIANKHGFINKGQVWIQFFL